MEVKESALSCEMKTSEPASVDISYTSSTYKLHNRVHTSKKVLGHVYAIYVISVLNTLKSKEKQWWPGRSVHTAIVFLKSEKSVQRRKGGTVWEDQNPIKHLKYAIRIISNQ